jgi:hypothetical protein
LVAAASALAVAFALVADIHIVDHRILEVVSYFLVAQEAFFEQLPCHFYLY